jgi:myo-inositol 2-dehydrogenase / D-chiro-inositol 1-dehydrogenase
VVGIGLIGAGRIGTIHAHLIRDAQGAHVAAIYDERHESALALASTVGGRVHNNAAALVADPDVAAVFICSPTDTHVEMISLTARAGKAIFCEKPIDLDVSRVRDCLRVLDQFPVPFTIGFHRRFDPHHRIVREEVKRGRIGRIEQVRIVSRDPAPPPLEYIRRSGGIFRDMMIHDLDQCRSLLEEEFIGVFAIGDALIDPRIGESGDFDTTTATFWTATGVSCVIQNSRRCSYGFDQRIEVFGEKGSLALDNVPLTQTAVFDEAGRTSPTLLRHFPQRYRGAYANQLAAFVQAIERGTSPETTAADGLMSLVLANAAERSATSRLVIVIDSASELSAHKELRLGSATTLSSSHL